MIEERYEQYDKEHCWQHEIKLQTLQDDLTTYGFSDSDISDMRTSDFVFKPVFEKAEQTRMKEFIQRYEWLGNLSQYTTHWFGTYYGAILSGVVLMNLPNSFSKMLGEDTKTLERLISRGASISWSPKNLASSLIMKSIRWMVENTQYRLFTAYSDPSAHEIGTIYQACNFHYLGQKFGGARKYKSPHTGKFVSDRYFRQKTAYKRFAKEIGIEWDKSWNHSTGMLWENVPEKTEEILRDASRKSQKNSEYIDVPKKHKYAYVLGKSKKETKSLKKTLLEKNKVYEYPKER